MGGTLIETRVTEDAASEPEQHNSFIYEQSDTKQSKQTDTDNQKKISIDSKNSKLKVQLISDLLTISHCLPLLREWQILSVFLPLPYTP